MGRYERWSHGVMREYSIRTKMANHFAYIVMGGKIIANSQNQLRYVSIKNQRHMSEHAEVAVIRKVDRNRRSRFWKAITLVVFRISDGKFVHSKPCLGCANIITRLGIHRVIYSTAKGDFKRLAVSDEHYRLSGGARRWLGSSVAWEEYPPQTNMIITRQQFLLHL